MYTSVLLQKQKNKCRPLDSNTEHHDFSEFGPGYKTIVEINLLVPVVTDED